MFIARFIETIYTDASRTQKKMPINEIDLLTTTSPGEGLFPTTGAYCARVSVAASTTCLYHPRTSNTLVKSPDASQTVEFRGRGPLDCGQHANYFDTRRIDHVQIVAGLRGRSYFMGCGLFKLNPRLAPSGRWKFSLPSDTTRVNQRRKVAGWLLSVVQKYSPCNAITPARYKLDAFASMPIVGSAENYVLHKTM